MQAFPSFLVGYGQPNAFSRVLKASNMQQAVDIVNLPAHAGHDGEGRLGKRKISDRAVVDDTQSVGH